MLTDAQARTIACSWHGGGGTALYALCSSGAITESVFDEVDNCVRCAETWLSPQEDIDNAKALRRYIRSSGERGPVPGWACLWDDEA